MKWNQCVDCGRFIGFKEFETGEAIVEIYRHLSPITYELDETEVAIHINCNKDKHG